MPDPRDESLIERQPLDPDPVNRSMRPRSLVHESLSRLTQHSPEAQELEERMRDVDARSFRGGQVDWSIAEGVGAREEQTIVHKLGRVAKGFVIVVGDTPLSYFATPAQRARWTREKIFFYVDHWFDWESGQATIDGGTGAEDITFIRPLEVAAGALFFGGRPTTQQNNNFRELRLETFLDEAGSDTSAPPYHGARIEFVGTETVSNDYLFLWQLRGRLESDTKFVWQVY